MKELFNVTDDVANFGPSYFLWQPNGVNVAVVGKKGVVHIYDRHGKNIMELLFGQVVDMDWNKSGTVLALVLKDKSQIALWNIRSRKSQELDTTFRFPTCIKFGGKNSEILAIGDNRGNLMLFDTEKKQKQIITGKHSEAITCMSWNNNGMLCLSSDDKSISISKEDGTTIDESRFKLNPIQISFPKSKGSFDNILLINIEGKTLALHSLDDPSNPIELSFNPKYGAIVCAQWIGEGYIIVGFSNGYFAVISTLPQELGTEISSCQALKDGNLLNVKYSQQLGRAAIYNANTIRIIENNGNTWNIIPSEDIIRNDCQITHVGWSEDGQILTYSTSNGSVHCLLSKVPNLYGSCGSYFAYLTSLKEVTIKHEFGQFPDKVVAIDIEPSSISLSENVLAVSLNNSAFFYDLTRQGCPRIRSKEYVGTIQSLKISNDYAAVLFNGQLSIHHIFDQTKSIFTTNDTTPRCTVMDFTNSIVYYTQVDNKFNLFYVDGFTLLESCCFQHPNRIVDIICNSSGTRCIIVEEKCSLMYIPATRDLIPIPFKISGPAQFFWDQSNGDVIHILMGRSVYSYIYSGLTIYGQQITEIGLIQSISDEGDIKQDPCGTVVPVNISLISVNNGKFLSQSADGLFEYFPLKTHEMLDLNDAQVQQSQSNLFDCFCQNLSLHRLSDAWSASLQLKLKKCMLALANKSMEQLDINMAIRVFRHLGDAGMVICLQEVLHEENITLLSAYVWSLYSKYEKAQELYMSSPNPEYALDLQCDLQNWSKALELAKGIKPDRVQGILLRHAHQLEFHQQYQLAMETYESALPGLNSNDQNDCKCGLTRMSIRCGDMIRARKLLSELEKEGIDISYDCAVICENMSLSIDAAQLYEKCKNYEKAVSIYLNNKNYKAAIPLMNLITSPKLHTSFAKAMETEKKYDLALKSYELARDSESVVRIYFEVFKDMNSAMALVRERNIPQGAALLGQYYEGRGQYELAVEFYSRANKFDQAFKIAQDHNHMDSLYSYLKSVEAPSETYKDIAEYYVLSKKFGKAGDAYMELDNKNKAFQYYMMDGPPSMDKAIDLCVKSKNPRMVSDLMDNLDKDYSGNEKEKYVLKLYIANGDYKNASSTALTLCQYEQSEGNYKDAHDVLWKLIRDMRREKKYCPAELSTNLLYLHSYLIIKSLVKKEFHYNAALCLNRVIQNISKFPKHSLQILTTGIIECRRASLKTTAYELVKIIMRPEYRPKIDERYKKKFEELLRRPEREPDDLKLTPCPFCSNPTNEYDLMCIMCKNEIPYCTITGAHIQGRDMYICYNCEFPMSMSVLKDLPNKEYICSMCEADIPPEALIPPNDVMASLTMLTNHAPIQPEEETPPIVEQKQPQKGPLLL